MGSLVKIIFIFASIIISHAEKCEESTYVVNNCTIHEIFGTTERFPCTFLKDFSKDFTIYFKPSEGFEELLFKGAYTYIAMATSAFSARITKNELKYKDDWNEIQFKDHSSKPNTYFLRFEELQKELSVHKHLKVSWIEISVIGAGSYASVCYSEAIKNMTREPLSTKNLQKKVPVKIEALSSVDTVVNEENYSITYIAIFMGLVIVTLIAIIIILIHTKNENTILKTIFSKKDSDGNKQGKVMYKSDKITFSTPKVIDDFDDHIYGKSFSIKFL